MAHFEPVAPLKQALVQTMRADLTLKTLAPGGFHEGLPPRGGVRPFVMYTVLPAVLEYDLSQSMLVIATFDVFAIAEKSVDAENIDGRLFTVLQDASLTVSGQPTLICRRTATVRMPPDIDEEGTKRIYQVGGTYEVIAYQS